MTAPRPWEQSFTIGEDRLRPLASGQERLDALVGLIDGAERTLRIVFYIYADDESGRRVRDALVAAAARGVAVSLVVDGFGSDAGDDFFRPLREAGGDVCRFIPRLGRRYFLRNHQKLALADERRAIIGGFNVSDDYFDASGSDSWRDLGLVLEGPAAARMVDYFDILHRWAQDRHGRVRTLRRALEDQSERSGALRWLMGGPTARLSPWGRTILADMRTAVRLDMIAAYFVPGPGKLRRIGRVARKNRGRVRIITAGRSDNNSTIGAARHTYSALLRRNVRIAEYQPAKLHTKLYVAGDAVHIGSANFDTRSLYLNLEIMLRIEDASFARAMRAYVAHEWSQSREILRKQHKRTGPLTRIAWSIAYFIVSVLDYNVTRRLNFGFADPALPPATGPR